MHSGLPIKLQGLPGCLPWGMILTFMNDYLAQVRARACACAGLEVQEVHEHFWF